MSVLIEIGKYAAKLPCPGLCLVYCSKEMIDELNTNNHGMVFQAMGTTDKDRAEIQTYIRQMKNSNTVGIIFIDAETRNNVADMVLEITKNTEIEKTQEFTVNKVHLCKVNYISCKG